MNDIAEKKSDILAIPCDLPAIALDQVADYYHKKLYDHPEALNFLKQKGLNTPALYARFRNQVTENQYTYFTTPERIP